MSLCRLIVCEKTSHWATALRAALAGGLQQVVETRGLAGCREALSDAPYSLVALETSVANVEAVRDFMVQMTQRFPRAIFAALLTNEAVSAEHLLREAGAIDCIGSVLDAPRVALLAERQMALVPAQELPLEEFVADRLPWPGQSSTNSLRSHLTPDN